MVPSASFAASLPDKIHYMTLWLFFLMARDFDGGSLWFGGFRKIMVTGRFLGAHWALTGRSLGAHWALTGRSLAAHWPLTGRSSGAHGPLVPTTTTWPEEILRRGVGRGAIVKIRVSVQREVKNVQKQWFQMCANCK